MPAVSTLLAVGVAGALGAVLRYSVSLALGVRAFPWATLGVNVLGCLGLALLASGPWLQRWSPSVTTAIAVGLLGSFTTFSAFGYETFILWRAGQVATASWYVATSVVLGIGGVIAGYAIGRSLI